MSDFVIEVLVASTVLIFASWYYQRWHRKKRMPPGPRGYPVLGNVLQLDLNNPVEKLAKWRKDFGDILTINLIGQDVVVVSSHDLIKEVLVHKQEIFSGRPSIIKMGAYHYFQEDVVFGQSTPTWKLKKKAMLTSLKMYGEELLKLEKVTLECIQETIQAIEDTNGKPFNPSDIFHLLIEHILAILMTGGKLPEEQNKKLIAAQKLADDRHFTTNGPGTELELLPWLRHFGHPVWKEIQQNVKVMWSVYQDMIEKRKAVFNVGNPECVIDGLLAHQNAEQSTSGSPIFSDSILVSMLINVFEAGVLTTHRSILSLIAILANHPNIQEKIHREIDNVIGRSEPRLLDRHEMHYTSACLHEQIRYVSIAPLLVPHMASKDEELGSYLIPKGTAIWCNTWEQNHDPDYWEDPWTFKPERFLDEQRHLVGPDHPNRRRIFSFGGGKRFCPGEVLAKNRLFLFIACLLQRFKFLPSEGKSAPRHDPRTYRFGTAMCINEYEVIAQSRSQGQY